MHTRRTVWACGVRRNVMMHADILTRFSFGYKQLATIASSNHSSAMSCFYDFFSSYFAMRSLTLSSSWLSGCSLQLALQKKSPQTGQRMVFLSSSDKLWRKFRYFGMRDIILLSWKQFLAKFCFVNIYQLDNHVSSVHFCK